SPAGAGDGGAAFPGQTQCPEVGDSEERSDPGDGAVPTPAGPTEPSAPDSWEQEEADAEAEQGPCPDTRKAGQARRIPSHGVRVGGAGVQALPGGPRPSPGPPTEEGSCTSSDDDVEGLRRRHVHEPRAGPPPPGPVPRRGMQDGGDEDGLSMSKYLLGALVLVAVALLLISGPLESVVSRDVADAEQESPVPADGSDSLQQPPPPDAGDPQSMQSVSLLLDKLAKENQDIRLMQAELQAHKEELQALLQKSEGAAAAAGAQQQSLAAENAELRAALQRETDALRAARAELQRLQAAGVPGSPQPHAPEAGEPAAEQSHGPGAPARRENAAWREGAR
ncbi:PBIP1 protein, partial [Chauna torquata]|nr:PBIP1 protein [Chauna torquata]